MTIDPTRLTNVPGRAAEQAADVPGNRQGPAPVEPVGRTDQVQISDEARELARQSAVERVPVTEARLEEIRNRLESGYYDDRPKIWTEIAQRLLESGDL